MATITRPTDSSANPLSRFLAQAQVVNWELIAYVIIFLLAIFTRFYILGDRVMSHDESLHTRYSYNLYADGNFQHTPLMHGPILFHVTAFFYFLFGDNDFTARIYPALLGVIVVMFPFLFRRWLGRKGALLASLLMLISPITMYYNRYIRHDTPSIFFALLMIYAMMMYISGPQGQRRKGYWLYLLAGGMIGNLGSKETAFIYIAIIGSFLTLYWLVRLAQHFWQMPGKTMFYFLMAAILLGGLAALGFYVVLSVIPYGTAAQAANLNGGWFNSIESSSFILWSVGVLLGVMVFLVGPLLWAFRHRRISIRFTDVLVIVLIAAVTCLGLVVIEELSHVTPSSAAETAAPPIPSEDGAVAANGANPIPLILAWVGGAVVVLGVFVSWRLGWWQVLQNFPEIDILIVIGTLILPWATPLIITAMGVKATDYSQQGIVRAVLALAPMMTVSIVVGLVWNWRRWLISAAIFYAVFAFFFTTMFTNINGLATGMIGSLGYWLEQQGVRRGSQPQYYYVGLILPFYEFLPVLGSILAMFSGMGLFWGYRRSRLVEQAEAAEKRKQQDDFIVVEEAADDTGLAAAAADIDDDEVPPISELVGAEDMRPPMFKAKAGTPLWLDRVPFLVFVAWWAVLNLVGYTLAGEKMPWLGIHLTLPLILLTGWLFGRVFDGIDWQRFRRGGWLYLILLPMLFVTSFHVVAPFLAGPGVFTGLQQVQLALSYQWLAAVVVSGCIVVAVYLLVKQTGWRHLRGIFAVAVFGFLSLLTARSALMASFINYDLATEYLVYAHAAPAVKTVLHDLEELSLRTTDGRDLSFAYDNETSWPYSWYFRDFPNAQFFGSSPSRPVIDSSVAVVVGEANRAAVEPLLEDRYYHFEYIRLWWPMQDYFNLTPQRISNILDFSPENAQAAQMRQGLFDIWWSRDYSTYGLAANRTFDITKWPVSDRMHFYVRKDVAAQIWDLGIGEGEVKNVLNDLPENVCNTNWQLRAADLVFGTSGTAQGQLNRPLGLDVAADGTIYVVEESNNRVSVFDSAGNFSAVMGQTDVGTLLSRPNGVALGPDGNIYVADTWNYQVKVMSPSGEIINQWGEPGEFGLAAQTDPVYGFWGPRDVAVDQEGRVYVADTGNKRVRVYSSDGVFLRDIGSGGSNPGQLDEPAGLALHPDGRLFVADYWNRRVSVFSTGGEFQYSFPVRGWYDEQGNRPYLAVDAQRDMLYVTDPDAGRVLVYDTTGNCLGSFGQSSREGVDATQFRSTAGIATDAEGNVFITDSGTGRVLRFLPFESGLEVVPVDGADAGQVVDDAEATAEVTAEVTNEVMPGVEMTEEIAG